AVRAPLGRLLVPVLEQRDPPRRPGGDAGDADAGADELAVQPVGDAAAVVPRPVAHGLLRPGPHLRHRDPVLTGCNSLASGAAQARRWRVCRRAYAAPLAILAPRRGDATRNEFAAPAVLCTRYSEPRARPIRHFPFPPHPAPQSCFPDRPAPHARAPP